MEIEYRLSPWVTWDIRKWEKFYDGIPLKKYSKKSSVFNQGDSSDSLYIVASGRVRIACYTADGGEKHLYIAEKGCLFCENALFSEKKLNTPLKTLTKELFQQDKIISMR